MLCPSISAYVISKTGLLFVNLRTAKVPGFRMTESERFCGGHPSNHCIIFDVFASGTTAKQSRCGLRTSCVFFLREFG